MVEREWGRERACRECAGLGGIVSCPRGAGRSTEVDDRERVTPWVACWIGVDVEEFGELHLQAGLFPRLPYGRRGRGLAGFDEAPR